MPKVDGAGAVARWPHRLQTSRPVHFARLRAVAFLLVAVWTAPAAAKVEIHFYSKDFASTFPHGFVRLTGTVESTGEVVDVNYGFTPVRVSPALLIGPVRGKIQTVSPGYVARSDRHFSLQLNEEQHRAVLRVVEEWRSMPQPSYLLNSRNCVFFVADVAEALGLKAPADPRLMKKPKSFLEKVTRDNSALIASWNNHRQALPARAATVSASDRSAH